MTTQANRAGVAKLWLLNFVANAAALAAWYFWLLIPDAHGWQVAGSVLLAACIIFLVVWLRAGTLAYFRLSLFRTEGVRAAFRRGLRHVVALALWFALYVLVEWGLFRLRVYAPQFGVWFRQKMPGLLRGAMSPRSVMLVAGWLLWFLFGVLLPAMWLPVATTVAAFGFIRGRMVHSQRVLRRPLYWVWFCALMFIGAYVPYKLIWWIPELGDLRKQAWSAGLRFVVAYFILITAGIALVWMTGSRTEKEDPDTIEAGEKPPNSLARGAPDGPIRR